MSPLDTQIVLDNQHLIAAYRGLARWICSVKLDQCVCTGLEEAT